LHDFEDFSSSPLNLGSIFVEQEIMLSICFFVSKPYEPHKERGFLPRYFTRNTRTEEEEKEEVDQMANKAQSGAHGLDTTPGHAMGPTTSSLTFLSQFREKTR
jgi:hypothetical protein